jgi:hypothetical protein
LLIYTVLELMLMSRTDMNRRVRTQEYVSWTALLHPSRNRSDSVCQIRDVLISTLGAQGVQGLLQLP